MAHDIEPAAPAPEGLELLEESTRGPGVVGHVHVPSFLVTAYRWGCTNEHAYHVYGGADRSKALALARAESAYRGGKYGCVVWEFDGDGTDYRNIAYFPSSMETDAAVIPHHNHRIDYFERIGQTLHEAASGKCLMEDPANPKHLTYQDVPALPEFLLTAMARQKRYLELFEDADAKRADVLKANPNTPANS